jgi:F-type H+-transporting ATPase subunit delta
VRERTRGFAYAVRDLLADRDLLGAGREQLDAVVRFLGESAEVRDVLETRGVEVATREAIVRDLLADKVEELVVELVVYALSHEPAGEVGDAIQEMPAVLASDAVLTEPEEISTTHRSRGYGEAVAAALDEAGRDRLVAELLAVGSFVRGQPELRRVLAGFAGEATTRIEVAEDLFAPRLSRQAFLVLRAAVAVTSPRAVAETLEQIVADTIARSHRSLAQVAVARALPEQLQGQVLATLRDRVGREVVAEWHVDPSLIGGLVAVVGDRVFDVSVVRELKRARALLVGS